METNEQTTTVPPTEAPAAPTVPPVEPLKGKRANWTIAHAIKDSTITWTVKGVEKPLSLDLAQISEANRKRAALHGMVQRVSDAAAMARDSKTGASATAEEKYAAMARLVEHYLSGSEEWSPARSVDGVGRPRVDRDKELLSMALGIHSVDKPAETIAKFVQALTKPQVVALLNSAQLKDAVAMAREEMAKEEMKAVSGVNAEELLSGL